MFLLKFSGRFKKDLKPYKHDKILLAELEKVLDILAKGKALPDKNHNHPLIGEFRGCFECHIKPDWLLIWKIDHRSDEVLLVRTGTHSDLF